jgi:uncharacterized protein YbaP (TraB family)
MTKKLLQFLACALLALAAPIAAHAAAFLWEVASMTGRVYLYGTVHAGKQEWFPLPNVVETAFEDSTVLVVEADITDIDEMRKTQPSSYVPPDTLAKHVEPEAYDRFRKLLPRYKLPEQQVVQMKPFIAVSLLVFAEWARLGFQPENSVDAYLIHKAQQAKKPVRELEGLEAQMQLMDSLTEDESKRIFDGTVGALESGLTGEQIQGMVKAWQEGDPRGMLDTARRYNENVPGAREFEEKFVWDRHEAMVKKIEGYLGESRDRPFVAVGALHLAGPRGLVEMLRKRGYIVRQLGT